MKLLTDYQGCQIRLTNERLAHILNHPELTDMEYAISKTLKNPEQVRVSRIKKRRNIMASTVSTVKVWFDKEGDYLEVLFSDKPGYMRETDNDAVMERVDEEGNLLGFSVLGVSTLDSEKPLVAELISNLKD